MSEPTANLLTHYRRDLHRIPEVDFELPQTLAYISNVLATLPGKQTVFSPSRSTLCCYFDNGAAHTTAIRTDMDALPVQEATGAPYASTHPNKMHACGHDGHMTMVLGLAHHLAEHIDELPRNILLVFQPAEETTGGAKLVCESGVFERYHVDRIFGFHLWPDLPKGQIASKSGALLAASNEVNVEVTGRASHIAKASQGADALFAATTFVNEASVLMQRKQQCEPCLLKFGHMTAGAVRNQIAGSALLEGSLRTFSLAMRKHCQEQLPQLAEQCARQQGCSATVSFSEGYPPVINDASLYALAKHALPTMCELSEPLLIAEDFAWYQQWLPGVFLLLGTGTGIPLHANTFDFDESILLEGLAAYEKLVRLP